MKKEREVMFEKERRYAGIKTIEAGFSPWDEKGKWDPVVPAYLLRKLKGGWAVYRREYSTDKKALHLWDEFLEKKNLSLREAKRYVVEELKNKWRKLVERR